MRLKDDEVKDAIRNLAEDMSSGRWGAWQCSLGGLVALLDLSRMLELDDGFWSEICDMKERYKNQIRPIVSPDPKDFLGR